MKPLYRRYSLLLVAFLYWISLFFYIPVLPLHVQERVSTLSELGFVLSMYGFWQMVSRFPIGIMADRCGWRKPLAIAMLILLSAGSLVLGSGTDFWGLTVGRSMIGFAAAAWVLLVVLYTSEVEPAKLMQATALMTIVFAAGRVTGSLFSAWLVESFGSLMPFWVSTGTALLAALILFATPLKKTPPINLTWQGIKKIILLPGVLLPSLISIILHYADWAATFSFIPLQAKAFGASTATLSLLIILELLIIVPANSITPRLVAKLGKLPLIAASLIIQTVAMFLIYSAKEMSLLWVAQGLLGISYGLSYPVLLGMSMEATRPAEHSIAAGFHQAVYALGMFSGPYISGLIASAVGIQPAFAVTGFVVLITGLAGLASLQKHFRSTEIGSRPIP